jgi:hypothetical protein
VTHTAVQRAIADGRLVRAVASAEGQPPRILPSIADVEWNERTSPAHSRAGPATGFGRQPFGAGDDYRRSLVIEKVVRTKLAQVRLDEVRTAGEQAWVYSTGEVSGRLRGLGTWMPILSWKHEAEVARREQGVWRLYGFQR